MYRSQADRMAEAARAQQITEQRIQEMRTKQPALTTQQFCDQVLNKPEILAMLKRLAVR
jgi:hypothetical protein